jgi:hypothetical protein
MPLVLNGTTGVQDNSGAFVAGTAVASTSGTSIDFTSIPSWVKRVTISFNEVSTNGSSNRLVQIGSGSVQTSGYVSSGATIFANNGVLMVSATNGFIFWSDLASFTMSGSLVLTLVSSNTWVCNYVTKVATNQMAVGAGSVSLSGALDRVRITNVNGTDTFDAGSINILYE